MKAINIVAPDNGVGLTQDRQIIAELLERNGYEVHHTVDRLPNRKFDLNIYCEVVQMNLMHTAQKNILIPNAEWTFDSWRQHLHKFDAIFCKTFDALAIFSNYNSKSVYTSFTSRDRYDDTVERTKTVAHFCGKSETKGTRQLLYATNMNKSLALTIYSHHQDKTFIEQIPVDRNRVTIFTQRLTDEQITRAINTHLIHVCASSYEGFGHYINEARSVGAIVITTNAAPMNELITQSIGYGVEWSQANVQRLAKLHHARPESIAMAIDDAVNNLNVEQINSLSTQARRAYLNDKIIFEQKFTENIKQILQ